MPLRRAVVSTVAVAVVWEVVGRLQLIASGAFPSLTAILTRLWRDRADYPPHLAATVEAAAIGFVAGNIVAITCALVFSRSRVAERLLRGVGLTLFAVPLIA